MPKAGLTVATCVGDDAHGGQQLDGMGCRLRGLATAWQAAELRLWHVLHPRPVKERGKIKYEDWNLHLTASHFRLVTERLDIPLMLGLHVLPGLTLEAGCSPAC